MTTEMPLHGLAPGQWGRVLRLTGEGAMRRRLLDIGLIPGTLVECVGCSPGGDPKAYCIRGAVIALRREDSRDICIERVTTPWG